ncbi:MAG: SIMPL domain-containing protein [Acidobacteria bacterium]|nr:SIMPL domain-containing protein [Acidobacteriota bacterium]
MRSLALIVGLLLLPLPLAAQDPPADLPIVVTAGRATLRRAPDRAFVSMSVETRAGNPRDAQRQGAERMREVLDRLDQAGVPKEAIRTTGYDVQQEFDFVDGRRVPRSFRARSTIEVRVDDVARVGELLDAVVQAGATAVDGVRFDLRDRDAVEREALRLAVADARARADAAAAGAGARVDRVLRIEEVREPPAVPMPRFAMAGAAEQSAVPVEPGTIEIDARVTLTASLK